MFDKFIHQLSFSAPYFSIYANDKNLYIQVPLIKQRGDNDPFLGNNVENFYKVFSDGISLFYKELIEMEYDQKSFINH